MFRAGAHVSFRASYFPFTEPSAEMDVECFVCGGKGCQVCKGSGWLEILGCGMVHPVVMQNEIIMAGGIPITAFGMGPERQLMLRYRIEDIRYFWANDIRFLERFSEAGNQANGDQVIRNQARQELVWLNPKRKVWRLCKSGKNRWRLAWKSVKIFCH